MSYGARDAQLDRHVGPLGVELAAAVGKRRGGARLIVRNDDVAHGQRRHASAGASRHAALPFLQLVVQDDFSACFSFGDSSEENKAISCFNSGLPDTDGTLP